nr:hypothetical protein [Tanacetum cinerariifolium]
MASFFQMNTASTSGSGHLPSNTIANPKGELKSITTQSGIVLDGPSVPIPLLFINPKDDERVEETLTDQDLVECTIKVPPPLVQKSKPPYQRNFFVHQRDPLHPNIPYPSRMHKQKQQEKDEVQIHKFWQISPFQQGETFRTNTPLNENCSAVILKKLPEKLGDRGKFLIPCGFSELKCKALADLDLFTTNHQSGNPNFSSHPNLTLPKVKDDIFDPEGGNVLTEKLLDLDSTKDLHPPHNVNPLSGSTTSHSSPNYLLEEFADEIALITFPPGNDDLPFDIESDYKEIEYLLNNDLIKDMDSILENSVDEDNLADTMPEMFTDEHAFDYSSPPLYDEYDDDLFKVESEIEYVYDDSFDSKREKIKESKLLIDKLDLPSDFLPSPEYDSFLLEDFFEVDALPLTNNEDKVFNPGILIQENLFEVITRVAPDKNEKKLAISHAYLILEDFDPPPYELPFFKEVLDTKTLLSLSFKNEEKVFKPGMLTSKGVYFSLIPELSHRGYKVFKIIKFLKSLMDIFLFSYGENIRILDVLCLHFYPH